MSQSGEGGGRESSRRLSLPDQSSQHSEGGQGEANEEQSSLRDTQRRRLSSPPSGSQRNEEDAQADTTRSPQAKRRHTTEDGEDPSPGNPDASQAEEQDAAHDDQHTSAADTAPEQADTVQSDRVEQHATTADESQPLEEAPNLATEEQYVSPADASLPHEQSLNLAIDERYASLAAACHPREESLNLFRVEQHASTSDACPPQEEAPILARDVLYASTGNTCSLRAEALNLICDEQRASASFTAPPVVEASNPTNDDRHPPLQQEGGIHVNVSELPERLFIPTEARRMINQTIEMTNLITRSQNFVNISPSPVYLRNINYVDECDEAYIRQLFSRTFRRNQRDENPLGPLTTRDYDDPLTRGDLQIYLRSLRGSFELDRQYMQAYNSQFLSRCAIAPETRECLIQWMIQLHMWMAIPVRTLHVAVGLMDLYTWLRPILPQEYQLLALGAIKLATRIREPGVTMSDLALCESAAAAYTPAQLAKMEEDLEECVGNRINFPTPYTFLEHYMLGLSDFSPVKLKWARKICKYFFDLGLCQANLCQYSASIRCAGVLYLIRCMQQLGYSPDYGREPSFTSPWSPTMEKFTGHRETKHLKKVAKLYGQQHLTIGAYAVLYHLKHRTNIPYMVVFNKYLKKEYGGIAMDHKLRLISHVFLNNISST
ncbi:putative cyclin-B3-1 [Taenia solium]|eukprot:TsM_000236800 transcript=TsM_000236800 gene=TsM_000236800